MTTPKSGLISALLIHEDQDPEVVEDEQWSPAAVARVLGEANLISHHLDWELANHRSFVLTGLGGKRARNAHALSLAGEHYGWLFGAGPLLLTARGRTGRTLSLNRVELLLIGTRLLIGEATQRALVAPK